MPPPPKKKLMLQYSIKVNTLWSQVVKIMFGVIHKALKIHPSIHPMAKLQLFKQKQMVETWTTLLSSWTHIMVLSSVGP